MVSQTSRENSEARSFKTADTYFPRLHLLCPSTEGHIGVAGARAIPFLLFDNGDEEATFTDFPFAAPVIKDFLDQLVILLQQQLGLLETDELWDKERK